MISMLDTKRPNIAELKAAEGEKDVEKTKGMIKEICDYLGLWVLNSINKNQSYV